MATTSPDNLRSPNPGDAYNLTSDWANSMNDVQAALTLRANAYKGTASARAAFTATATDGMLWTDTDSINMIWRKAGAAWVPAVWDWSGTTTQMNAFAAPDGFKWYNTTDNKNYVRLGGAWVAEIPTSAITAASGSTITTPTQIIKIGNWVHFTARVTRTSWTNGVTAVTLPVGFRPILQTEAPAIFSGGSGGTIHPGLCQILTNGNTNIWQGSTTPVSGASVAFSVTFPAG